MNHLPPSSKLKAVCSSPLTTATSPSLFARKCGLCVTVALRLLVTTGWKVRNLVLVSIRLLEKRRIKMMQWVTRLTQWLKEGEENQCFLTLERLVVGFLWFAGTGLFFFFTAGGAYGMENEGWGWWQWWLSMFPSAISYSSLSLYSLPCILSCYFPCSVINKPLFFIVSVVRWIIIHEGVIPV